MSDYLNNLVSRTLNPTPAVKPRLASLYEPLSVSVSDPDRSQFDMEISPEEQTLTREPFKSTSPDRQVNSRLTELPEPVVEHSLDQKRPALGGDQAHLITAKEPSVPFEALPALIPEPPQKLIKDRASIAAVNPPDVRAIPPSNIVVVRPLTRDARKPESAPTSSTNESEKTLASDLRMQGTIVSRPQDVPNDRNTSIDAVVTRLTPTEPKGHQSLEIISQQTTAAEPAAAPGKISVTIGRVDVRAMFAPPQVGQRDRPKTPAAMSLDDYLKQRTGGGR